MFFAKHMPKMHQISLNYITTSKKALYRTRIGVAAAAKGKINTTFSLAIFNAFLFNVNYCLIQIYSLDSDFVPKKPNACKTHAKTQ